MNKSFLPRLLAVLLGTSVAPLSFGAAGYLYESDFSTGTIYQFTTLPDSGTVVKVKFASGFTGVRGLAFDRSGNLFVGEAERIYKITPNGFGTIFASDIRGPNSLAFNRAGDLFVTDRDGHVLRFSPQGDRSVFVAGLVKPTGLAFDAFDNLFVADYGSNTVFKVTPDGSRTVFAQNMKGPQGVAFSHSGVLHVVNEANGTVEVFNSIGSRRTRIFSLAAPIGLAFDRDDNLFIANSCVGDGTNSILKFTAESEIGSVYAKDLGCPLQLAIEPPRDPLFNISTRARVEPVLNHELIGGFIVSGAGPKTVLLRALGPSLSKMGVAQPLLDPILQLHTPDGVFTNNNWMDSQKEEIQSTGLAPKENSESAILITLNPGAYTAVVRGNAPFVTGNAVVEVYDADLGTDSNLSNISSRGYVQSGDNRMIAGVSIGGGNGAGKILVRGLGPSLAGTGIADPLPDPKLSMFNAQGTAVTAPNDDWGDTQGYEIYGTGIPPASSLESAILITLTSGAYTAILEDLKGNPGVGLIEVYNLR
ncbi:MAG TPA: NHL repeat-containing protein [Chthoniobacterales bacterium]|nr:NHL repeat-containing protein [Chthoniobacterales bacterium]